MDNKIIEFKITETFGIQNYILPSNIKTLKITGVCDGESLDDYFRENGNSNYIKNLDMSELKVSDDSFYFIIWFDNLRTVIFPRNQEIISTDFNMSLKNYVFPNNLQKLQLYLSANKKIKELVFPDSLKSIYLHLAKYSKVETIKFGKKLSTIENFVINPNIKKIEIDPRNKHFTILSNALYTKDLKKLIKFLSFDERSEYVVLEGVQEICEDAFEGSMIKKIVLPKSLKKIGESAFGYCRLLEEVIVPDSVTEIGNYAFSHCENLKKLKLSNNIEKLMSETLEDCFNLDYLYLPDNLKTIEPRFFNFTNCLTTVDIIFNNKSPYLEMIDGVIYSKDLKRVIVAIDKTKKSYKILDEVETIDFYAFSGCQNLEFVRLPDSVTDINSHAFSYCTNLKKVVIGKNLKKISYSSFAGCSKLKYVVINTIKPPKSIYNSDYDDFDYISYNTVIFVVPFVAQNNYNKASFWRERNYTHNFAKPRCSKCNYKTYSEEDVNNVIQYATDGDMYSQFELSLMYEKGIGVEKDLTKSVIWLKKSAEQGYLSAMYNLSHYYSKKGEYDNQINLLKQIRRQKIDQTSDYWLDKENLDIYLRATNDLGVAYYDGNGVRKSYKKAFELYRKSARYGVDMAISNKGVCYEWGRGTHKNAGKAFCCYRHATQKGSLPAMVKLANCYSTGTGVNKDKDKYMFWMQKALNQEDCDAQNAIAFEYLTGKFLEKDLQKAKKYFMLSINNPNGGVENKSETIESARNGNKLDIKMLKLCGITF